MTETQTINLPDDSTENLRWPVKPIETPRARPAADPLAPVEVAQAFPRNEDAARDRMLATCSRLSVASRAFYELPDDGGFGLSVHAARELARLWGNVDYGVRELRRDGGASEVQTWAWDQEANTRSTRSLLVPHETAADGPGRRRRAIADPGDIYLNNQNAGARAVRECIFSVLPGWFIAEAEAQLKATLAGGDGQPLDERIADTVARFAVEGVTQTQLEARVGRPATEWQPKHLLGLARVHASITIDGIPTSRFFAEEAVQVSPRPKPRAPKTKGTKR